MEQIAFILFTIDSVVSANPFCANKYKSFKRVKVSNLIRPGFVNNTV